MRKSRNSVDQIVTRYARQHQREPATPGTAIAAALDRTESLIVEFRRDGVISDRRMIALLRRHQKEITGRL